MSHAASHYVKHLVTAPNGERITAPEKSVLLQLADDHREDAACAWPSVGAVALRACLSLRQCRRVLASIERKGIILRMPTSRLKDGGQSSNEYIFVQLDDLSRLDAKKREEALCKYQRTPRSRMTGGGGHVRPTPPVTDDLHPRSSASGGPGHLRPPIDSSLEQLQELLETPAQETHHPLPPPPAEGQTGVSDPAEDFLRSLRFKIGLSPAFGEEARRFRFGELAAIGASMQRGRRVLLLSSPDPPATKRGLAKHAKLIDMLLEECYDGPVQLQVHRESNSPT